MIITGPIAIAVSVVVLMGVVILRYWATEVKRIQTCLRQFQIQEAECFAEADRPLIQGHVANLEKSLGLLVDGASEEEAISSFNTRVQEQLMPAIHQSLGTGLPYREVVAGLLPVMLRAPDNLVGQLLAEAAVRKAVLLSVSDVVDCLIVYPIGVCMVSSGTRRCLKLQGKVVAETSFRAALTLAVTASMVVSKFVFLAANTRAADSNGALGICALLYSLGAVATAWGYGAFQCARRTRSRSPQDCRAES
jgi:hypothetical protein